MRSGSSDQIQIVFVKSELGWALSAPGLALKLPTASVLPERNPLVEKEALREFFYGPITFARSGGFSVDSSDSHFRT